VSAVTAATSSTVATPSRARFVYEALAGRVVFGSGSLDSVGAEVEALGGTRVLLVRDEFAAPEAARLHDQLGQTIVAEIDGIRPHVPMEQVLAARRATVAAGADTIVSLGGGSTTGLAKAVVLEHDAWFVAVPTTYAGSEMTPIYGITEDGVKRTGRDVRVKPAVVVYDPDLTIAMPASVTAGSTMNAIAHCVEALYAQSRNPVITSVALDGVRALRRGIEKVAATPGDPDGRAELLYGSFAAGTALAAVGMAIHHRICHVLGGTFGLAHGDANAVILPHAVAANTPAEPQVMGVLAEALGGGDAAGSLFDLAGRIGAPRRLDELGMTATDLERVADLVVEHAGWNPRPVSRDWVAALLQDALVGRRPQVHT
jgi:maleylacetate reductase